MGSGTPGQTSDRSLSVHAADQVKSYAVHFRKLNRIADTVGETFPDVASIVVVSDDTVWGLYGEALTEALGSAELKIHTICVPTGEQTKSLEHLGSLLDKILAIGVTRQTPILAIGGGVVGDLAGFAAATVLRGLPLLHIPTTVISQVDSAIGGKTGINHPTGKNLIGAFHQPAAVHVDTTLLQSLPEREWLSGLAEVVKHALISSPALLEKISSHITEILARDQAMVDAIIPDAASVKVDVVSEDALEKGRRMILNFGHTFGHSIERCAGYGRYTHGEAVFIGMRAAMTLSQELFDVDPASAVRLLNQIPTPDRVAGIALDDLMDGMNTDKKRDQKGLRFIVLDEIGSARVVDNVSESMVRDAWRSVMG